MYGPDADIFRPERWLENEYDVPAPYHFTFGAGARGCTGINISNRIVYAIVARCILSFKIISSEAMPANIDYARYNSDTAASTVVPAEFKVRLVPRDKEDLQRFFQASQKMSADTIPLSIETLMA